MLTKSDFVNPFVYCRGCHNAFIPVKRNNIYCSDACKQKAYRDRKRLSVGVDYGAATEKILYTLGRKTCRVCGNPLTWRGSGRRPTYCSNACRQKAYRRERERILAIMDNLLQTVIEQAPNMIVAIVVLYWQARTIDRLLTVQIELLDRYTDAIDNSNGIDLSPTVELTPDK